MLGGLRGWAEGYTREGQYSPVGVWYHWIMAALVLYQLGSGWRMDRLSVGADRLAAYQSHSEIALTLLLFGLLRGLWRLLVTDPVNDADAPGWQSTAAHAMHYAFYGLFALLPLSGWAMWSAIQPARPLQMAGIVPVPPMPFYDLSPAWQHTVLNWANDLHVLGVIGLALLVPLHVGAALKHHFLDRDDVVTGILPHVPDYQREGEQEKQHRPQQR